MTVAGKNRSEDAWERPRILLLASMWPPQTGGVEEYLSHVYSRLECLDLWVVAPHHSGASAYDRGQRWKTKRFSTDWFDSYWTGRRRRARAFWALTRMISVNHIECIHAGSVVPDGVLAWMLPRA